MERYNSRALDEMARIVLPSELRKKLGLESGDKLSMTLVDTIIILHQDSDATATATCQVSDLGVIELPRELRQKLGWEVKNSIAVYNTDSIIILKLAEKE